jgi:hypothetical protein
MHVYTHSQGNSHAAYELPTETCTQLTGDQLPRSGAEQPAGPAGGGPAGLESAFRTARTVPLLPQCHSSLSAAVPSVPLSPQCRSSLSAALPSVPLFPQCRSSLSAALPSVPFFPQCRCPLSAALPSVPLSPTARITGKGGGGLLGRALWVGARCGNGGGECGRRVHACGLVVG